MKVYNQIKGQEGFTLLEVIIALAILGIISISIITIFSSSFTNIFSLGNRSKALAEASKRMEILYTIPVEERSVSTLKEALEDDDIVYVEEEVALYQPTPQNIIRFTVKPQKILQNYAEQKAGYEVTIVVFYQNGQRKVTLNTFLRGGSSG